MRFVFSSIIVTVCLATCLATSACLAPAAWAEEGDGEPPNREEKHQRLLDKFDEDGDGKLTGQELKAARQAGARPRGDQGRRRGGLPLSPEMIAEFDADGDGSLSQEERKKAHQARHQRLLKEFDED
ncbi:MAG TPA: EF-hand domain-containing protein, partial [Pirellulales bacterium]|nr:EF-hand domain-containing protein [Pirellulales bacterium]